MGKSATAESLFREVHLFRKAERVVAPFAPIIGMSLLDWERAPAGAIIDTIARRVAARHEERLALEAGELLAYARKGVCRGVLAWEDRERDATGSTASRLISYMHSGAGFAIRQALANLQRNARTDVLPGEDFLEQVVDPRPTHAEELAAKDSARDVLVRIRAKAGEHVSVIVQCIDMDGLTQREAATKLGTNVTAINRLRDIGHRTARGG